MLYNPLHDLTEVGQALHKAADILDERGHAQLDFGGLEPNDPVCLVAALRLASGHMERPDGSENQLYITCEKAVVQHLKTDKNYWSMTSGLCRWNNHPGRTGDEVSAMLRELGNTHKKVA
jgi:hypothetical protein